MSLSASDYIAKTLNVRDGLSQSTVNDMLRDSRGFLWLGTNHGLNRYDNNSVRQIYSHDPTSQLVADRIVSICEDSVGGIWIMSDGGLTRYYHDEDRFRRFVDDKGGNIKAGASIVYGDRILFGVKDGRIAEYFYDLDSIRVRDIDGWPEQRVIDIRKRSDGKYVLHTRKWGMYMYDPEAEKAWRIEDIDIKSIIACDVDSLDNLWLAVYGEGLYKYDADMNLKAVLTERDGLSTILLTDLLSVGRELYVASESGLEMVDILDHTVSHAPFAGVARQIGACRSLYRDEYGNFYAGTVRNGATMFQKVSARTFSFAAPGKLEMPVMAIVPSYDGTLWCGVDGNGVYKLDPVTNNITHVESTAGRKIVGMARWPGDKLIYYCYGGDFHMLDMHTLREVNVPSSLERIARNARAHEVGASIFNHGDSVLSVLTDSVYMVYPYQNRVRVVQDVPDNPSLIKGKMLYVYGDDDQLFTLWYRHIYRVDRHTLTIEPVAESPQRQIYAGRFDGRNTIFMATADTIYSHNIHSGETVPLDLPSVNNISSMHLLNGKLWFGASTQLFVTDNSHLVSFNDGDGVVPNEFMPNVTYADSTYIYFGGTNGLARVNRRDLATNGEITSNLAISLAELEVNGTPSLSQIKDGVINIPPNNSMLRIKVINKEFNQVRSRMYRFILEGVDFDRPFEVMSPTLTLGELPQGRTIRIKVSCTQLNGQWSEPQEILTVRTGRVWWMSWWFIVIVVLAVGALGAVVYRMLLQSWRNASNRHRMHALERDVQILANINDSMRTPIANVVKPIHDVLDQLACEEDIDQQQLESDLSDALDNLETMQAMVDNPFGMLHPQNLSIEPVILSARFNVWVMDQVESFAKAHRSNGRMAIEFDPQTDPGTLTFNASRMEVVITCLLSELYAAGTESVTVTISDVSETGQLKVEFVNTALRDKADWNADLGDASENLKVMYARWLAELDNLEVVSATADGVLAGTAMLFRPVKGYDPDAPVVVARESEATEEDDYSRRKLSECSMAVMYFGSALGEALYERIEKDFKRVFLEPTPDKVFEKITEHHPEVVIIDGVVDPEKAIELCVRIKTDPSLPDTAVIIVTMGNASQIREKVSKYGADAYIERPFDKTVLINVCRQLLGLN